MTYKKTLIPLFFACTLIFLLSSCTKKEERPKLIVDENTKYITIALRAGIYSDVIEYCLPEFEIANNVKCNVEKLSEDGLHKKVASASEKGAEAIELCMVDGSWMAECAAKGSLMELSQLGYQLDDDIIPATTKISYYNDKLYLAPYYGNVTVLLYNKMLLKFTGFNTEKIKSLEDIYTICLKAKKSRNLGFMYRGDTNNNVVVDFLPILLSFDGWVVDKNNKPTVNTKEFNDALTFYMKLIATGKADSKDNLTMAIANGAAAMGIGWPGWYTPNKKSAADYIALNGKAYSISPNRNANVYGVWTLGIPASSREPEISAALLKFLMDKEMQKRTVMLGGVPCRYSSLKDPEILQKFPQYNAVCSALEGGIYRPIMTEWTDFYTILGDEMKKIISKEESVDDGLKKAQARLEQMLVQKRGESQ